MSTDPVGIRQFRDEEGRVAAWPGLRFGDDPLIFGREEQVYAAIVRAADDDATGVVADVVEVSGPLGPLSCAQVERAVAKLVEGGYITRLAGDGYRLEDPDAMRPLEAPRSLLGEPAWWPLGLRRPLVEAQAVGVLAAELRLNGPPQRNLFAKEPCRGAAAVERIVMVVCRRCSRQVGAAHEMTGGEVLPELVSDLRRRRPQTGRPPIPEAALRRALSSCGPMTLWVGHHKPGGLPYLAVMRATTTTLLPGVLPAHCSRCEARHRRDDPAPPTGSTSRSGVSRAMLADAIAAARRTGVAQTIRVRPE